MIPKDFPDQLSLSKCYADESDLPTEPTPSAFLIKFRMVDTKRTCYSIARFLYSSSSDKQSEWILICGAKCFVNESTQNTFNVIAWAKIKLI